jgi:hypothetical protein
MRWDQEANSDHSYTGNLMSSSESDNSTAVMCADGEKSRMMGWRRKRGGDTNNPGKIMVSTQSLRAMHKDQTVLQHNTRQFDSSSPPSTQTMKHGGHTHQFKFETKWAIISDAAPTQPFGMIPDYTCYRHARAHEDRKWRSHQV